MKLKMFTFASTVPKPQIESEVNKFLENVEVSKISTFSTSKDILVYSIFYEEAITKNSLMDEFEQAIEDIEHPKMRKQQYPSYEQPPTTGEKPADAPATTTSGYVNTEGITVTHTKLDTTKARSTVQPGYGGMPEDGLPNPINDVPGPTVNDPITDVPKNNGSTPVVVETTVTETTKPATKHQDFKPGKGFKHQKFNKNKGR